MKFEVYGPFSLPLKERSRRLLEPAKVLRADFVKQANEVKNGKPKLSEACGCYVFAIRRKGGARPWYVGKTEKMTFGDKCLNTKNINTINSLLDDSHGQPDLYLLPQITRHGKFRSPTTGKRPAIDFLETMLIGMGIERNPDIANIGKTKMHGLEVAGFFKSTRPGPRGRAANKLRGVFGLKKK